MSWLRTRAATSSSIIIIMARHKTKAVWVWVGVPRPIEGRSGSALYRAMTWMDRVLMDSVARMLGASQDQVKVRDRYRPCVVCVDLTLQL